MNASRVTVVMSGTSSRVVVDSVMMNDSSKAAIVASIVNNVVAVTNIQSGIEVDLGLDYVYEEVMLYSRGVNTVNGTINRPTVIVLAGGDVDVSSNATVFSKALVEENGAMIYTIAVGDYPGSGSQQGSLDISTIASQPVESHAFVCLGTGQLSSIPPILHSSLQQGKVVFGMLGHDVFYLCFSSSARIDFSLWREKKKQKIQRKCVPLDKFALTSTVLDRRRERDRLLDANNSIMETDGEGKFVSFKVVLGGRLHRSSK